MQALLDSDAVGTYAHAGAARRGRDARSGRRCRGTFKQQARARLVEALQWHAQRQDKGYGE
jgi:hypothetical protein